MFAHINQPITSTYFLEQKENVWKQKFRCSWKSRSGQFMSLCTLDFLFQWDLPVKSVFHGELEQCAFDRLLLWHQLPKLLLDSFGLWMGSYAFRLAWLQSSCLQICFSIQYNTDLVSVLLQLPEMLTHKLSSHKIHTSMLDFTNLIGLGGHSVTFSNRKEVKFSI